MPILVDDEIECRSANDIRMMELQEGKRNVRCAGMV